MSSAFFTDPTRICVMKMKDYRRTAAMNSCNARVPPGCGVP
ncbi:hypothetical protein DO70_4849 [Burkholderia pseudomallei]|nr:hypothetical protein DO70_4849 [Burkholderia pseudomallei]